MPPGLLSISAAGAKPPMIVPTQSVGTIIVVAWERQNDRTIRPSVSIAFSASSVHGLP